MIATEQLRRARGEAVRGLADPLVMFAHCHMVIRRHLRALETACELLRDGTREERAAAWFALDMARAQFAGPVFKHTEDEELSLFPRLRALGAGVGLKVLEALDELESQHRTAEHLRWEFNRHVAAMPRDGSATERQLAHLEELVAMLAALYRPHINVESELVFPVAARALPAAELLRIKQEMLARRAVLFAKN